MSALFGTYTRYWLISEAESDCTLGNLDHVAAPRLVQRVIDVLLPSVVKD